MSSDSLTVRTMKIADLVPDEDNLKQHPSIQIEQLKRSIERFGFNDPIGVSPDGLIIEGHGRYEAAKQLGMTEVPVLIIEGLTDKERKAYAIAHNQTTMNTPMDREMVRDEFDALGVQDGDFMSVGYTSDDVAFLSPAFDDDDSGMDHNGHARDNPNQFLPSVLRAMLPFSTLERFDQFQDFLMCLRRDYPEGGTIAERIMMFIEEYKEHTDGH